MAESDHIAGENEVEPSNYGRDARPQIMERPRKFLTCEARLAMVLIERWGMVTCLPDGEDSAGRAKFTIMPPRDVVNRACEVAERAIQRFNDCGWMVDLPSSEEAEKMWAAALSDEDREALRMAGDR
jgi:hypothetical protein